MESKRLNDCSQDALCGAGKKWLLRSLIKRYQLRSSLLCLS